MISIAIVASGPLLAAANRSDPDHRAVLGILEEPTLRLVVPALCVAEVAFLLGRRQGPSVEAAFLRGLRSLDVRSPAEGDWTRMADLVETYADFPLGGTDASVIALAERMGTDLIVTLDRRHFSTVRSVEGRAFRLLP